MKTFNFLDKYSVRIILYLALIIAGYSLLYNPYVIFVAYLIAFLGLKLDMIDRKPICVSTLTKNSDWNDKLVYAWSISFIKLCFSKRLFWNKDDNYYSFTPYDELPQHLRAKILIEYFDNQE
jgi:hypothetical protein